MKKIAVLLIEYGFDFNYEHHGSSGEQILIHSLDCEIATSQGVIYFNYDGESDDYREDEFSFLRIIDRVEKLIIKYTN